MLMVKERNGTYRCATYDDIMDAARKVVDEKLTRGCAMTSPKIVAEYLTAKLRGFESEVFSVMFLDNKHELITYSEMFYGTIHGTAVHTREIVKAALKHNASAVVIAHNHPSGNDNPSDMDITITGRIKDALDLIDVRLLDHFIIAGNNAVSLAAKGLI